MVNLAPTDPRRRLLDLASAQKISLAALSEMIGRNSSYLQQFIRKGSPRKLEEGDRRALAQFLGVADSELGGVEEKSSIPVTSRGEWVEVPRLALGASAGPGALAGAEAAFDTFRFSRRWLREQGLAGAELHAIRVEGDSMQPLLQDGDEILIDLSQRALRDGVHVVRLGDALMVKRLSTAAGPGRVVLISQNLAYPAFEVAVDDLEIVGRVVWKSGRL